MKKMKSLSKAEMKKVLGGLANPNGCLFDNMIKCTCPNGDVYCVFTVGGCEAFCLPIVVPSL